MYCRAGRRAKAKGMQEELPVPEQPHGVYPDERTQPREGVVGQAWLADEWCHCIDRPHTLCNDMRVDATTCNDRNESVQLLTLTQLESLQRYPPGPGRRGEYSPRLPQIRTCPIKASGSSSHGLAAHGDTRGDGRGNGSTFSSRLSRSQLNCPRRFRRDSHFGHRRTAS